MTDCSNPRCETWGCEHPDHKNEILEMIETFKKLLDNMPPRCVILFNDQMKKDAIVQGESVDEMLGCENNEKGFIVSDLNREDVMKFGGNAVRIVNNPNPFLLKWKDIKIEVREPNWGIRGDVKA